MDQENKSRDMGQTNLNPMKRYYRLDEVAAYFAISRSTVYRLIDEGYLRGTKIRKCMRVSAEEMKRFEERIAETTSL